MLLLLELGEGVLAEPLLFVQFSQVLATVGVELGPFLLARGDVQLLKPGDVAARETFCGQHQQSAIPSTDQILQTLQQGSHRRQVRNRPDRLPQRYSPGAPKFSPQGHAMARWFRWQPGQHYNPGASAFGLCTICHKLQVTSVTESVGLA